jgi:rod shape-determining protein MreD
MSVTVRRPVHHFSPLRGRRWRLRFILFLLLLASVIIQGAVGSVVFFSFRPDLVLIIVVYWALKKGPSSGWFVGMAGGFMTDLFSSGRMGLHTLALATIGLLVASSSTPLYQTHLSTRVVMVGIASVIYNILYYLFLLVFAEPPSWNYVWKAVLVPSAWQTILIAPIWLWLTDLAMGKDD